MIQYRRPSEQKHELAILRSLRATLLLPAFGLVAFLLASEQRFHTIKYVGVVTSSFSGYVTEMRY